jgi:hypothetical protein
LIVALAAAAVVSSAATGEAQVRGRVRGRTSVVVVGGGFYSPYYDPFFYADPWWGYQYPYPMRPYGYGYRRWEPEASVRLEVKPKEAEVYVDGYYAGVVDDFDGTFQRLHIAPGGHAITLYLEGYRTVTQNIYARPDQTVKLQLAMDRLQPGEASVPVPVPARRHQ